MILLLEHFSIKYQKYKVVENGKNEFNALITTAEPKTEENHKGHFGKSKINIS